MLKLTISRPNTIGVTHTSEYESYKDAEDFIERRCESLANRGWELSELKGSNSQSGTIEATHDNEADILLIQWKTVDCDDDVSDAELEGDSFESPAENAEENDK